MKAIAINKFGGTETMNLIDVADPVAQAGEILIKVTYAGVNPVDWKIREGYLTGLLPHHFPLILGWDVAGTVAAKGTGVTDFQLGDRVYAYARKPEVQAGTYAEFVAVSSDSATLIPQNLTDAQAAGVPLVALTAWQALIDTAQVAAHQTVLVHAGAGGVGGYAIQFAKLAGATVITTATKEKHAYLLGLGADIAIDYSTKDFAETIKSKFPDGIDVILDCVGGDTLARSFALLKTGGALVSIVDTPDADKARHHGLRSSFVFVQPSGIQLKKISDLIAAKEITVTVPEVMPLKNAAQAHLKSETRRTVGKIVLKV